MTEATPRIRQVVFDCEDVRALAEFYRQLFGLRYREGDEPPIDGPDDRDWLALRDPQGGFGLAFQQVEQQPRSTWPADGIPQMLHLDTTVSTSDELRTQHDRAIALGARLLYDRFDDDEEPLFVFADPEGHPFCIFVGQE